MTGEILLHAASSLLRFSTCALYNAMVAVHIASCCGQVSGARQRAANLRAPTQFTQGNSGDFGLQQGQQGQESLCGWRVHVAHAAGQTVSRHSMLTPRLQLGGTNRNAWQYPQLSVAPLICGAAS